MPVRIAVTLLAIGVPLVIGFTSHAFQRWHYVFDDAFITYRYAHNLALGYGITWNPGLPPTEGYTNFLLVIILAPFLKIGFDPLLVTRLLSYTAALVMAVMLALIARRRFAASTPAALMIGAMVLLVPETSLLCLVGLETIIYSLMLLITFHAGVEFYRTPNVTHSVFLGLATIATMLLRPEAAILWLVIAAAYVVGNIVRNSPHQLVKLIPGTMTLLVIGGMYLAWKQIHFAQLLPNSFYVKASDTAGFSTWGLRSVNNFTQSHAPVIITFIIGFLYSLLNRHGARQDRRAAVGIIAFGLFFFYLAFYARTDTLMDIHGRFLYPLLPILIYASIPLLAAVSNRLENWNEERRYLIPLMPIAFLLLFGSDYLLGMKTNAKLMRPANDWQFSDSLMQKEYQIAKALSQYPDIEKIKIAGGDAGVIPYFTRAIWLDPVGLNDSFIARNRDKELLLDYFFEWQVDLVMLPSNKDHSWITYGHGPYGNIEAVAKDPRWDDYVYVGTSVTATGSYDIQFFVRKNSVFASDFSRFLQSNVVDGFYRPTPFSIGKYTPTGNVVPQWIPRATASG